jgi:glutamate synthase (ferredoxin)
MFQILDKSQPKKEPIIKQVFIGKNGLELTEQQFNAKLFAARKIAHTILNSKTSESHMFYFSSLSTTTIIYKGIDAGRHQQILYGFNRR